MLPPALSSVSEPSPHSSAPPEPPDPSNAPVEVNWRSPPASREICPAKPSGPRPSLVTDAESTMLSSADARSEPPTPEPLRIIPAAMEMPPPASIRTSPPLLEAPSLASVRISWLIATFPPAVIWIDPPTASSPEATAVRRPSAVTSASARSLILPAIVPPAPTSISERLERSERRRMEPSVASKCNED
jgi:hypothetical protein